MKRSIIILMLGYMLAWHGSMAQDSTRTLKKNAIYLELGGNGSGISLNYERMLFQKNKIHIGLRIGGGLWIWNLYNGIESPSGMLPLAELNLLMGKGSEFFETGIGYTLNPTPYKYYEKISYDIWEAYLYYEHMLFLRFGYRYQNKSGFIFRGAATPAIIFYHDQYVTPEDNGKRISISPWIGFTIGQSF